MRAQTEHAKILLPRTSNRKKNFFQILGLRANGGAFVHGATLDIPHNRHHSTFSIVTRHLKVGGSGDEAHLHSTTATQLVLDGKPLREAQAVGTARHPLRVEGTARRAKT